jgi:hypothetical protein
MKHATPGESVRGYTSVYFIVTVSSSAPFTT